MLRSMIILFVASILASVFVSIAGGEKIPEIPGGTGRYIGAVIGGSMFYLAAGLIFFLLVRFFRRKSGDQKAGLLSGLIAILIFTVLAYVGTISHS